MSKHLKRNLKVRKVLNSEKNEIIVGPKEELGKTEISLKEINLLANNKDLDEESAQRRFNMLVKRGISKFVKRPIKNKIGLSWVRKQRLLKKMTKENFLNEKSVSWF